MNKFEIAKNKERAIKEVIQRIKDSDALIIKETCEKYQVSEESIKTIMSYCKKKAHE